MAFEEIISKGGMGMGLSCSVLFSPGGTPVGYQNVWFYICVIIISIYSILQFLLV